VPTETGRTEGLPRAVLGRSNVEVTRFGFGGAPLGSVATTPEGRETAAATLAAAWDEGVRTFDVAPFYGLGRAERAVGGWLAGRPRDEFVLSTKVGRIIDADGQGFTWDFSADGVRRSLDASLERLGLDRVDVALIHDPDNHVTEALEGAYPALEELRSQGVVRAIGFGMNHADPLERFVRDTDIDCVLVAGRYSLLDDRAAAGLLPAAAERGVGILVGGVFNSGVLAAPGPEATFNYHQAPPGIVARAEAIRAFLEARGVPLTAAAEQYPLRHPAVTAILVGGQTPAEVHADVEALRTPIPEDVWAELERSGLLGWRDDEAAGSGGGAPGGGGSGDRAATDATGRSGA